jgi:hypothetical protein
MFPRESVHFSPEIESPVVEDLQKTVRFLSVKNIEQ